MPEPKKGDTLKATKGKVSKGIKTFESMSSTTELPKEKNKEKEQKNNEKDSRGRRATVKQQDLWAWKPNYKITTAIPLLGVIGILFSIVGAVLIAIDSRVKEVVVDYTDCKPTMSEKSCHEILNVSKIDTNGTYDIYLDSNITDNIKLNPKLKQLESKNCFCEMNISATDFGDDNWDGDVFIYYGLDNFNQNHRMYVKSRDNQQLQGDIDKKPDANSDIKCTSPFDFFDKDKTIPYFPCGAIANSLFNDTITLQYSEHDEDTWKNLPVLKIAIAHPTDKELMFGKPSQDNISAIIHAAATQTSLQANGLKVEWPKDWGTQQKKIWTNVKDMGFQNEDFIVWMRTAANPNFRKIYGRIDHVDASNSFKEGLPAEFKYRFQIEYNYNAKSFGGRKKAIISTVSFTGGKNCSVGTIYFLTGVISLVICIGFVILKKNEFLIKTERIV